MYKILIKEDDIVLLKNNEENWDKTGTEDVYVETYIKDVKTYLNFGLDEKDKLKLFLLSIVNTRVPFYITFRPYGKSEDLTKAFTNTMEIEVEDVRLKTRNFTLSTTFNINSFKESYGVSDYRYVYDFMPKWSTAFKFPYSTHTKTVEPFFTNLMYIKEGIKRKLKGYNAGEGYRKTKDLKPYGAESYITLSEFEHSFFQEYLYLNDSQKTLDFGKQFTTIHITPLGFLDPFDLIIEGEYNNCFISEMVRVSSEGSITLSSKFNKIYNIVIDPFSTQEHYNEVDFNFFTFKVSNFIPMEYFSYQSRDNTFLSIDKDIIIQFDKNTLKPFNFFKLPLDYFSSIFIDKDDHIYVIKDNNLYSGKLDMKLNIPIPLDPSYNNSKFIEECKLTYRTSSLELFIPAFIKHSGQSQVAVKIISSNSPNPLYLTDDLDLVESETPIYLDTSLIQFGKSLTLDFKMDSEWTIIRLEDRKNLYSVSHLMVMPVIELIKLYSMDDVGASLEKLDIDFEEDSERVLDYTSLIFVNNTPHLKFKFINEPLFSYLLAPLDVKEDYKLQSNNNIVKEYSESINTFYEGDD